MKSNKIYVAAVIVFVIGIALAAAGFATSGFDFDALVPDSGFEQHEYAVGNLPEKVNVSGGNFSVVIKSSSDGENRVIYSENKYIGYSITEKNGTLTVKRTDLRKWYEYLFFWTDWSNGEERTVTVELADEFAGGIDAEASNGSVTLDSLTAGAVELETRNGRIVLKSINADSVECETSNGEISVSSLNVNGNCSLETSNATVSLDTVKADGLEAETNNGKINLSSVTSRQIKGETSNGKIFFDKLSEFDELKLETHNGTVQGTLKGSIGDYNITSKTHNGENTLPKASYSNGPAVSITTSNGDINVTFAK